jgi:hypothetical protein
MIVPAALTPDSAVETSEDSVESWRSTVCVPFKVQLFKACPEPVERVQGGDTVVER